MLLMYCKLHSFLFYIHFFVRPVWVFSNLYRTTKVMRNFQMRDIFIQTLKVNINFKQTKQYSYLKVGLNWKKHPTIWTYLIFLLVCIVTAFRVCKWGCCRKHIPKKMHFCCLVYIPVSKNKYLFFKK